MSDRESTFGDWDAHEIERLEAELAACEQVREAIAAESRDRYAELADLRGRLGEATQELGWAKGQLGEASRMLADLRASSVVVRRKCDCRKGRIHDPECGCKRLICAYTLPCPNPDCDNGWQLVEGVQPMIEGRYHVAEFPGYLIPARLIEGDT